MRSPAEPGQHCPSFAAVPGHPTGTFGGYRGTCSCGWTSMPWLKKVAAQQAALDHAREANERAGSSR